MKGKQTYLQLAKKYKCSTKTIQRKIDQYKVIIPEKKASKSNCSDGYNIFWKKLWSDAF